MSGAGAHGEGHCFGYAPAIGSQSTMQRVGFKEIVWVIAIVLIGILAFEGHRIAGFLPRIEQLVGALGPWGPVVYVLAIIVLTPLMLPVFILGIAGGVVFGLPLGALYYAGAVYVANLLLWLLGRRVLRRPVLELLERKPSLRKVVVRAKEGGAALVFWIRLLPVSPAPFSYAFGAIEVPLRAVALGSIAMVPHLVADVYFGAVAAHVTKMAGEGHQRWAQSGIALVLGLASLVVILFFVSRIAKKHL